MTRAKREAFAGKGLIDLLVTIVVVTLIVLVALPALEGSGRDESAQRIRDLSSRIERACATHYRDTGRLALEFSAPSGEHSHCRSRYHGLGLSQLYTGWDGPYLEHPVTMADNPFGGAVELRNDLDAYPARGFALAAEGDTSGRGQFICFERIPENVARRVDETVDGRGIDGWASRGRIEYRAEDGGTLSIFLMRVD